jgi:type I restriction enzyme S subunit
VVQRKISEKVEIKKEYKLLGVRWYAKGPFIREVVNSTNSKATRLFPVKVGDFIYNRLFAWKGSFGLISQMEAGCYVSGEFPLFECDSAKLIPEYLFLYMSQPNIWLQIEIESTGSTTISRNRWKESNFLQLEIVIVPVDEQKRIVDLVSSVDTFIEALEYQLEQTKKSRDAVLRELLTSDDGNWVVTNLSQLCKDGIFSDGDWVESKDQDPTGEYRLLQLADIGDGYFLNKSDRWMNAEQFKRLSCTTLEVNDVLIARMPEPIGRACLFPENLPTCATVVDVAIVRTGDEILQKFLVLLINSTEFRSEAFSLLTGTTRQRVSKGNLGKISFSIPPKEKQLEIISLISEFNQTLESVIRSIEETRKLRSALLSDLLSGNHEIPETYNQVMAIT